MRPLSLSLAALLVGAPTALAFQNAAGFDVRPMARADRPLLIDDGVPGAVWARGTNWKASFGAEGFAYTPYLGPDVEQNHPVRFELAAVTIGGTEVEWRAAEASVDGRAVTLDRGALREVYHLDRTSVEQTFAFDTLPAAGEVSVRLNVTSDLARRAGPAGATFHHDGGHVTYGAAFAVDARGQRMALEQRWDDRGLELVVPADFAARATMPLIIDPVLQTFTVEDDTTQQVDLDIAYDPINDLYMIVYEDFFSITDRDVISEFYSPAQNLVQGPAAIDITNERWSQPRVANNYQDSTFLCVATIGSVIGQREVHGRVRSAATGNLTAPLVIGSGVTDHALADVGGYGNDVNSSTDFCVVWQRLNSTFTDSDIVARCVSSAGTTSTSIVDVSNVNGQLDGAPVISKSSGPISLNQSEHRYMVVWEREVATDDRNLLARVIEFNGSVTGNSRFVAYTFSDSINPDVSMQHTSSGLDPEPYWVMVFERQIVGIIYDVFAVVLQDGDADNARNVSAMQDVPFAGYHSSPKIAHEGLGDFIVTYGEHGVNTVDAYATTLNVVSDGNELRTGVAHRVDELRTPDGSLMDLAIASSYFDGGSPSNRNAAVVWIADGTSGSDGDIGGAVVTDTTQLVAGSQYCNARTHSGGTSGWLRISGSGSSFVIEAQDMPANTFCLPLCSMGNDVTPFAGGSQGDLCLSGGIGRFNSLVAATNSSGLINVPIDTTALPTPSAIVAAQPGDTWYFQLWFRDVDGGMQTSNYTNGVSLGFE